MTTIANELVHELTLASYGASIRAAVRGLWNGAIDEFGFVDTMISATFRGLEQAWTEGAKECGVSADERSPEEETALAAIISRNTGAVRSFATSIAARSKAEGKPLGPHLSRAGMWVNRYNEARNQARAMACADQKYQWQLGLTDHCSSCLKLSGKVKRASAWDKFDIRPQSTRLECKGYRCQCQFVKTDAPISRGRMPSIP